MTENPSGTNYHEEYQQMELAIKSGPIEEFPLFFEGVIEAFTSLKQKKLEPEAHEVYFKCISLPKIISYIMTRR